MKLTRLLIQCTFPYLGKVATADRVQKTLLYICTLCMAISLSTNTFAQTEPLDLDALLKIDEQKQAKIDAAFALMEQVQQAGAYIESISELLTNQAITLPVGIKQGEYELIIQKITYNSITDIFRIYATCAFTFKEDGERIAFEGAADIEGQKGLGTTGYLKLIAPIRRDMGQQATLVFLAETQVNFGCEGIESFDAKIGLLITSDKIIAVNKQGAPTGQPISTIFEASFANFNKFTASFSFNNSFMFKGLDDVIFTLKGASIDQDDEATPASIQFPENYFGTQNSAEKNSWRGISIAEASVVLPAALKMPNSYERISLALKNVVIDNNGFSAFVEADNIMHGDALDKTKWDISVSDLMLTLEKNELTGFGFGGDLNIPPFGKNSLTPYKATYNASVQEYEFVAGLKGTYDFPVFRGKLELLETSTLSILLKDSEIYPTINASGKISIDAPINKEDSTKKFGLPDVNFEQLKISREDPYISIGAIGVTGTISSPKVAGFELTISSIKSFTDNDGAGLAFDAGIKISDMFKGDAGLKLYGDYKKFKFDRVAIDKAKVEYNANAFSIMGGILFKNGDALYGTGFRGELTLTLVDKFKVDAIGVFGKVGNYRYFLTDAFTEWEPSAGIPVLALSFYGFGGGLYKSMQQSSLPEASEFGKSLSGVCYVPDNKVGMGFSAATKFCLVGGASTFNAKASFEMQFNEHGGLNFVQLRGDGSFMSPPAGLGSLADALNKKVKDLEKNSGKLKLAAKSDLKVPETLGSSVLSFSMNVKYDVANKVFSADIASYLNAGFIKGIGDQGKMGWASAYFAPDSWYTYLGTPTDRLGVDILGLAKSTGYFMIGDKIPALPPPPEKVLKNLSADRRAKIERAGTSELGDGKGIAFGQSFELNFNAELVPFYAKLGVGLGAEFLLIDNGPGAYCAGSSGTLGINGWYAQAQAWAYAEAEIGMGVKIFRKYRNFSILDISAGTLLTGAGPNPFYFTGSVGGHFSVMGGMVSGQCDFDFEIGEECIVQGGSPFGQDIIASLTPGDAEKDVNVFVAPQLVLNIPANLEMRVEESEGLYGSYKIIIETFDVRYKDTKQSVTGLYELSEDGKVYMLDPNEPFESQKQVELYAKISFMRKLNGAWDYVKGNDNKPIFEEKTYTFTSGDRPKYILPQHVKYSYPINRQFNFYPKEYDKGYLLVTENYSYLFTTDKPQGYSQVVRVTQSDQVIKDVSFTHKANAAGNEIRLEIDFSTANIPFTNNAIYKLALINKPIAQRAAANSNITAQAATLNQGTNDLTLTTQQAQGNLEVLEVKELYGLDFRTSDFNTLQAKMDEINPRGNGWRDYLEPNVHDIKANVRVNEGWDRFEYDQTKQLITIEADLNNTNWYKGSVYDDMYTEVDKAKIARSSTLNKFGYPPTLGIKFMGETETKLLSDDEINLGSSNFDARVGNMTYSIPYWASLDFANILTYIANKKANGHALSNKENSIIASQVRPKVTKGEYPIIVKYWLPGKNTLSSSTNNEMYNPVD